MHPTTRHCVSLRLVGLIKNIINFLSLSSISLSDFIMEPNNLARISPAGVHSAV